MPETNEKEDGYFKKGTFSTSEKEFKRILRSRTRNSFDRINIIKGFYSESFTEELLRKLPKAGIVHIDVDLYSSTKEVLRFIKPLLVVGTILLFDDWYCFPPGTNLGERKALNEFLNENKNFEVEAWKSYSTFGKSFFINKV